MSIFCYCLRFVFTAYDTMTFVFLYLFSLFLISFSSNFCIMKRVNITVKRFQLFSSIGFFILFFVSLWYLPMRKWCRGSTIPFSLMNSILLIFKFYIFMLEIRIDMIFIRSIFVVQISRETVIIKAKKKNK